MQNSKTFGKCQTCHRYTALTKHHLIPKKHHRKEKNKALKREFNDIIEICRMCHDGIHDLYDESTLATTYDTLEKLRTDERLKKHFTWVSKCKKGIR